MWPFKKKTKRRRLEARKAVTVRGPGLWRRFVEAGGIGSSLLAALFCAGVLAMDLYPTDPLPYRAGQYIPADIHSRVAFEIPSKEQLEKAVEEARRSTAATFKATGLSEKIVAVLAGLPQELSKEATTQPDERLEELWKQFGLDDGKGAAAWRAYAEGKRAEQYRKQLAKFAEALGETAIVPGQEARAQQEERTVTHFWLMRADGNRTSKKLSALIPMDQPDQLRVQAENLAKIFDKSIQSSLRTYLLGVFGQHQPLYRLDSQTTEKDIEERIKAIEAEPPTRSYRSGQVLVPASRRRAPDGQKIAALSGEDIKLLRAEHETFLAAQRRESPWQFWLRLAGRATMLLLIAAALCWYIARYERGIVANHWRGFAVAAVLLLMLGVSKAMVRALDCNPHATVLTVVMTAVLMTIAYNRRLAIALAATLAVLTVLQLRVGLEMLLVLVAAVVAAVVWLREIRSRSKLIEVTGIAAAAVVLTVLAAGLAQAVPLRFLLVDSAWGAGFTLLVGFLIQGILPIIERVFGIATSMTLLEWCDASRPLLRRLAMEAPGTYNHSLQLGAMCEAAAEAIGARGLLARVGAYYHDVGKINKPDYFVENRDAGAASKHDKLLPAMSMLIITGHVKDGLELAREYGLPRVLHEFVATHHGTTLVQYFYHAATEQRRGGSERPPDEMEFRYPGPKPTCREAAVLMLADASESSVRAMTDPTPGRIENQVHTMVSRRLMDGQLDNCEMTLREVHRVETSLIKSLCGIYHARLAYPAPPGQKPSAAEQAPTKTAQKKNSATASQPAAEKPAPAEADDA